MNGVRLERAEGQPLTDATARQRRMALLACIAMLVGTALLLPFAAQTVGSVPAFFPVYQTAAIGCCLITAYLLYAHFQAVGAVPLLHLAGGYLYIAMVMVMQMASYEGMVPEGSTAMGGPQTAIWLWLAWHLAPALSVMVLVLVQGTRRTDDPAGKKAAAWQTAFTVGAAGIATATLVFGFPDALPVLEVGGDYGAITRSGLAPALQVLFVAALVMQGWVSAWPWSRPWSNCTRGRCMPPVPARDSAPKCWSGCRSCRPLPELKWHHSGASAQVAARS